MKKVWSWLSANSGMRNLLLLAVGAAVVLLAGSSLVARVVVLMTRAAPAGNVSLASSYILGSKLVARADGTDKVEVLVFVRDKDGRGVPARSVTLSGTPEAQAKEAVSDGEGKASFTIVSKTAGQFKMSAEVNGVAMPGSVTITFR